MSSGGRVPKPAGAPVIGIIAARNKTGKIRRVPSIILFFHYNPTQALLKD
jgi:hypothetical protein